MIGTQTNDTITLNELEEIKKWCEYRPDYFMKMILSNNIWYFELLKNDNIILNQIKKLYALLKINNDKIENTNYVINLKDSNNYDDCKEILKIIYETFSIEREAKYKLTPKELYECQNNILNNKPNIEIDLKKIDSFYIRSYSKYLVLQRFEYKNRPNSEITFVRKMREY